MKTIALDAVPNQSFSARLDGFFYEFVIKETAGVMSATISRDNEIVVSNSRICAGSALMPYPFQQKGNFIIITENGEIPYWTKFGITQQLLYLTDEEIAALPYPPEA